MSLVLPMELNCIDITELLGVLEHDMRRYYVPFVIKYNRIDLYTRQIETNIELFEKILQRNPIPEEFRQDMYNLIASIEYLIHIGTKIYYNTQQKLYLDELLYRIYKLVNAPF